MELPESENIGKAINDAMRATVAENDDLRDVLPKTYNRLDNLVFFNLLKNSVYSVRAKKKAPLLCHGALMEIRWSSSCFFHGRDNKQYLSLDFDGPFI
jgi:hypothetical protein